MSSTTTHKPAPSPSQVEQSFDGFAALPLEEIAARAKAVTVPDGVMERARARLREGLH